MTHVMQLWHHNNLWEVAIGELLNTILSVFLMPNFCHCAIYYIVIWNGFIPNSYICSLYIYTSLTMLHDLPCFFNYVVLRLVGVLTFNIFSVYFWVICGLFVISAKLKHVIIVLCLWGYALFFILNPF